MLKVLRGENSVIVNFDIVECVTILVDLSKTKIQLLFLSTYMITFTYFQSLLTFIHQETWSHCYYIHKFQQSICDMLDNIDGIFCAIIVC